MYGVAQVRDALAGDHGRIPEDHRRVAGLAEQRDPRSEQQRDEINVYLIGTSWVRTNAGIPHGC
jgi:hypothetical protein